MRRTSIALLVVALPVALLAACGDDDGGGDLSAEEQEYVAAWRTNLTEDEDGIRADDDEAECMATSLVRTIGIEVFVEADVQPEDIADGDSPGSHVGDGAIAEADARAVVEEWRDCADVARLFAESARQDFGLDDDGVDCVADGLGDSDALETVLVASFTTEEGEPEDDEAMQEFVAVLEECSADEDGQGGALVDSLAESFAEDGTLTDDQARCLAQELVDTVGSERLIELSLESGDFENAPPDVQQEFASALVAATGACDVPLSAVGG